MEHRIDLLKHFFKDAFTGFLLQRKSQRTITFLKMLFIEGNLVLGHPPVTFLLFAFSA